MVIQTYNNVLFCIQYLCQVSDTRGLVRQKLSLKSGLMMEISYI